MGTGIPVVVSERIDPSQHPIPWPWRLLRRLTYPRARAIVLQTRAAASYFPASWAGRIVVVPNPVPATSAPGPGGVRPRDGRRLIVGMGRLERQKGFDLMIRAFAAIAGERPDWDATILGDGPERGALAAAIAGAGMTERIALPGRESDAMGVLRRADLFVLSSRYEGFPNALCEAMACGLPVVAFDCRSGPAEIVRDGVDGLLVPAGDVGALASAMSKLTGDPERRRAMGARATEVSERFSIDGVAALWESVLERRA
jgi:glycosyltransferase involved in cell wall biosynthesis